MADYYDDPVECPTCEGKGTVRRIKADRVVVLAEDYAVLRDRFRMAGRDLRDIMSKQKTRTVEEARARAEVALRWFKDVRLVP